MKQEERLNNIDTIISKVNDAVLATQKEWVSMSLSIPSAKTLDKEILPQITQSLSSLSTIDTAIMRNHYYGRLLSLTTKESETINEETAENLAIWEAIANKARSIVESMYKAEMFDGFGDDDPFKQLNSSVDNFCNILFDEPSQLICEYLQKPWLEDSINIGLFGKYSSGKTTILNSLYGENFPTNNAENTAVPTYLYHGNNTRHLVLVDVKGRQIKIDENEVSVLDTNLSESFPFYLLYEYIAKQNPNVPENRTIIDAPGVMGKNSDLPVIKALKQCDVVVWLLDIRGGLSGGMKESDLEFIKKHVSKPLFIVLTYTDRLDDKGYCQALSVIADGFKKAEVDVKGFVRYNKYEEDEFRKEFNKVINMGISQLGIEPQSPYSYVNHGVSYIRHILKSNEEFYTKMKNEANLDVSKYQNSVNEDCEKINNKIDTLINRTEALIDHWRNNWIAGDGFKTKIVSLANGVQYVIDAWKEFDLNNIVQYAQSSRSEQEAIYKLQLIESLKEDFENSIGKLFKNK